jgi:hypothetical protein
MTAFLPAIRRIAAIAQNKLFSLPKPLRGNGKRRLEIDDFAIL